jgi:hypothetical protein
MPTWKIIGLRGLFRGLKKTLPAGLLVLAFTLILPGLRALPGLSVIAGIAVRSAVAVEPADIEKYLTQGELESGLKELQAALLKNPKDEQARLGLGIVQVLRGVEEFAQALHRHGLHNRHARNLPFFRIPVPENPHPEKLTYEQARQMFLDFQSALVQAEGTLSGIQDENFKLPLRIMQTRLKMTAGPQAVRVPLSDIAAQFFPSMKYDQVIDFDYADALWLRGYCHLLTGLTEILLGYDAQEMFNVGAHLVFARPVTPYPFLELDQSNGWFVDLPDLIATVHMFRLPVKEPQRLKAALGHFEQMFALSRKMIAALEAETDDANEWLPNPRQSAWNGARISAEMFAGWLEFVTEMEHVLAGRKLLPLWRGNIPQGINLRRVFLEPTPLDPVLWWQGTAAAPYLEKGTLVDPNLLNRLQRTFQGDFFGFAMWIN